ncbi:MAG: RNA polymerase sigma factor FliA [Gammaproteobacteria bacterium]|nr:RNA polymerase sigma factor FliA [Gammaproteobacteria bacterium]
MYKKQSSQDDTVSRYAPLVKRIAHHLIARLPSNVQVEDLIQAGMIGLLEASRQYDASKGASFETYAGIRIRGAMLDELRQGDWVPRSVHRNSRRIAEVIREVEARTSRDARDSEVAEGLGVSLDEYQRMLFDGSHARIVGFEDLGLDDEAFSQGIGGALEGPESGYSEAAFQASLTTAIAGLPERERLVLALYYDEELNLKEIGAVLSVSESRVCQIHTQAMCRLKARLKDWTH